MHISRLVIRNFRNFQHLDVPINGGITCIIGENNTGKTNLLHALRLVLDVNLSSAFRQLSETDVHCCVPLSTGQQVLVSVEFTNYADKAEECAMCGLWEFKPDNARITYRFRPRQSVREAVERGEKNQNALAVDDYQWELTGGTSAEDNDPATVAWNEKCGEAIRFSELQSFKIDFLQALRDVENDLRNFRLSPLNRLLTAFDIADAEKEALIKIIGEANNKVVASPTIAQAGTSVKGAFANSAGEAFAMELRLGMIAPTFVSIARNLSVLLSDGPVTDFEPSRNGLGLNNVLYVSMLLEYFRRRVTRADTAGQLLLIEEPEAHLHPQLQRVLYAHLRASGFQTFVTTHSTHISSASNLSSYVILTDTGGMATSATVASRIDSITATDRADLERYLDATRSSLLFARRVLLVEGPAELFLIPMLVKEVMKIDLARYGISVVPIHGVHFAPYAKLFCQEGIRKKCAIVTDGDLKPSDSDSPSETAGEEDAPAQPRVEDLEALQNKYLRVFSCTTTFERTLVLPGLLKMLHHTCKELGAPRIETQLSTAIQILSQNGRHQAHTLDGLDVAVLRTAKRFGKARFAQVASKYVEGATALPDYIDEAVKWLLRDEPNE